MRVIGYVGLGAMGAPMLARLAAPEDETWGYDANAEVAAEVCAKAGARCAETLAEIAGACDVLFTCLPNNDIVREVYLGKDGIAASIREGSVTIDCSTVGPDATRDVHEGLQRVGVQHLDASMLGSVQQANEGTISFVVGGDETALESVRPVLERVGGMIRHCGASGAGNQMKLLHQVLVAGHAVAVGEVMALCDHVGADSDAFYDIVTQGTGFAYSRYFEKRVPRMASGDYSALFMLKFMLKDARLARDMGQGMPALDAVIKTLEDAVEQGHGEEDFSAVAKTARRRVQG